MERLADILSPLPYAGIIVALVSGIAMTAAAFLVKLTTINPIEIVIVR